MTRRYDATMTGLRPAIVLPVSGLESAKHWSNQF